MTHERHYSHMHQGYAAWYYTRTMDFFDFPEPYVEILAFIKRKMNEKGIYGK